MASVVSAAEEVSEPSPKRRKLSTPTTTKHPTLVENPIVSKTMPESQNMAQGSMGSQLNREDQVGILCFVNESNPGFSGILKQRCVTRDVRDDKLITSYRYTDFLVNEVTLDGKVVHLTDINAPRRKAANKVSLGTSD